MTMIMLLSSWHSQNSGLPWGLDFNPHTHPIPTEKNLWESPQNLHTHKTPKSSHTHTHPAPFR